MHRILGERPTDYYGILGLDKSASQAQIKKAYVMISRQIHPDKFHQHKNDPDVQNAMKVMMNAADMLKNFEIRVLYDRSRTAAEFQHFLAQYHAEQVHKQQQGAEEEVRKKAMKDAELARQAAEHAAQEAAEEAAEQAAGDLPREQWYRGPKRNAERIVKRRQEQDRGPQTNAGGVMDSNRTRLKQASKQARAKSVYEARPSVPNPNLVAYFAAAAARQPTETDTTTFYSHLQGPGKERRLPMSATYRHEGIRYGQQRFGRLENKERSSMVNLVKSQKQGRQKVVETARNSVPGRADFSY